MIDDGRPHGQFLSHRISVEEAGNGIRWSAESGD
jgi:hypothetical protein